MACLCKNLIFNTFQLRSFNQNVACHSKVSQVTGTSAPFFARELIKNLLKLAQLSCDAESGKALDF
jgi:hypothetical protein